MFSFILKFFHDFNNVRMPFSCEILPAYIASFFLFKDKIFIFLSIRKLGFIDILFYSIFTKFILTTVLVFLVQNYNYIYFNYDQLLTFFKNLMDFYLMWIISMILLFNLTQYSKKLKSSGF